MRKDHENILDINIIITLIKKHIMYELERARKLLFETFILIFFLFV